MTDAANSREIRTIDLFAGCGGLTEGFRSFRPEGSTRSPYHPVAAVEMEHWAASTYLANFGADESAVDGSRVKVTWGKIESWDPRPFAGGAEVILGGPPCQGFSGLGNGDPKGEKNHLWQEYVSVVQTVKPKVFVMENVDRFLRSPEYEAMHEASKRGGALEDYHIETKVLNAADYGVAQRRRRVIVLATRHDLVEERGIPLLHPVATHAKPVKGEPAVSSDVNCKPWVTVGESVFASTRNLVVDRLDLPARSCENWDKVLPGPFRTSELHIGRQPTEHSLRRYRAIPEGGNRHDLPEELSTPNWIGHKSGSGDVMGRLRLNEPSVTIRTEFYKPEKGRYLHPTKDRPITHLEAAMIQGFPMDFKWCGSKAQIARQIGNAVPIGLGHVLAQRVYEYLTGTGDFAGPYQPMFPTLG
ncbi:DNA (cytosine-5)-methyltransferase 1 [Catenulispora sp. MAP5-51]|uniref:DNA cytosine methyltransferase n=1 Tax=Catenulispora sp. MAP5-51 TaxID=3156298 RepID=UPI0035182286